MCKWGFSGGTSGKKSTCNAGDTRDLGSIAGLGRSPGEGLYISNNFKKFIIKNGK